MWCSQQFITVGPYHDSLSWVTHYLAPWLLSSQSQTRQENQMPPSCHQENGMALRGSWDSQVPCCRCSHLFYCEPVCTHTLLQQSLSLLSPDDHPAHLCKVSPDHLTCLLRNLYADQEATVRTAHGTTNWFQIRKGVCQGCILSACLLNLYAEYIMWNAGLDKSQAGVKIAGRNINNLRYADNTTLMAESKELKASLWKWKRRVEKLS